MAISDQQATLGVFRIFYRKKFRQTLLQYGDYRDPSQQNDAFQEAAASDVRLEKFVRKLVEY